MCKQRRGRRYLAGRTGRTGIRTPRRGGGVVVHDECTLQRDRSGGRTPREIAQRVDRSRPLCCFFQYNNNVVRYFFPLPKRVSFTLPRARATFCFLARLTHTHTYLVFFVLSDDHHFPPVVQCRKSSPKSSRFEVLGPSSAPNDLQPMMYII